jgi:cephalosporin hydroxylase
MGPSEEFQQRNAELIEKGAADESLRQLTRQWFNLANTYEYSYHYAWMSRPVIQYPQDIVAMQEIIWKVKPDLIIETGIAHGGSLIMSASMLALLDYCEAVENGTVLDPKATKRRVIGIDIDIREHNRTAMEAHPMAHRIDMIQGSSVDPAIVRQVHDMAKGYQRVLVCLDSNHTHDHVLQELKAYAPLASMESYCVVFDTVIEDLPDASSANRPWGKGDNPKTAVWEYMRGLSESPQRGVDGEPLTFEIDRVTEGKLLITVAPDGYLRRVRA